MPVVQIVISSLLALMVLAGLSLMSRVKTAVAGNLLSALTMLAGIIVALLYGGALRAWAIWPSIALGALIGGLMASRVKMIDMPQTVALFNGLGGGASALVGALSFMGDGFSTLQREAIAAGGYEPFVRTTALLAVAVGMITLAGSLVAAGKLHRLISQKPIEWALHSPVTLLFLMATVCFVVGGAFVPQPFVGGTGATACLVGTMVCASLFGVWFAVRVGGADMPITISLLNSLSGVAGAIAGMAVGDVFLVAVGGIVGASGLFLTQIMCRAMNRSLRSILTGGVRTRGESQPEIPAAALSTESDILEKRIMDLEKRIKELEEIVSVLEGRVKSLGLQVDGLTQESPEKAGEEPLSAAGALKKAKDVIIVPGYGMALAQAQHQVRQLADRLESRGTRVRFAIHPVAGRMPGHMNVLLAEADIDYEKLFEMESINDDFAKADAVVVVGANDVMNPAARHAEGTPIYGMPVLNVDAAPNVIICNFDLRPGYAGVENPLYSREKGVFLELGDAKATLQRLMDEMA